MNALDVDEWTPDVAEELARRLGIGALGDAQWRAIALLRELYAHDGCVPDLARVGTPEELRALFGPAVKHLPWLAGLSPFERSTR